MHNIILPEIQLVPTNVDTQVHIGVHSPHEHADIIFRGNKNGNGPKLGSMNNEDGVQVRASTSLQLENAMESCNIMGDMTNVSQ